MLSLSLPTLIDSTALRDTGRDVKTNQNFTRQKQAEDSSVTPPSTPGTAATPTMQPLVASSSPGLGGTLHTTTSQVTVTKIIVIIVIVSKIVRC